MQGHTASNPKPRLSSVVRATGVVSFFTDMGSEIIYPLMPMFLRQLGASRMMIGWIEGLAEGLPAVIKLFSGALSDRVRNRKWLMLAGYGISTVTKPFIGLTHAAGQVLGLRVLDRVGKGIRGAPRDALVADHTDPAIRGHAFGYQRAMDHAGAVAGGLIGFALLAVLGLTLRHAIVWALIPGALAVLAILLFVHDKPDRQARAGARPNPLRGLARLPRTYFLYVAGASLFAMGNSSDAFLLLRSREVGVSVTVIPLLWSFLHVVKSATSLWGGKLSDRAGRMPLLVTGWVLYGLVYLGFALCNAAVQVWVLFACYGLFFGLTEGASRAVIADLVPEGMRGTAFGFWGMVEGVLLVASSVLTGWLWDRTGSATLPLALCGALSLLGALSVGIWVARGGMARGARA